MAQWVIQLFQRSWFQIPAITGWLTTIRNETWCPFLVCLKTATVYLHIIINKSLTNKKKNRTNSWKLSHKFHTWAIACMWVDPQTLNTHKLNLKKLFKSGFWVELWQRMVLQRSEDWGRVNLKDKSWKSKGNVGWDWYTWIAVSQTGNQEPKKSARKNSILNRSCLIWIDESP